MEIHAEKRGRPAIAGRPQADRNKFFGVLCSQLLDGYGAVTREEDGFPTVAGEEKDLSVFGFPAQPPQRGGAAIIVKIGKGVIQNQRDLLLCRKHQLANGQPGGQIQLIGGSGREQLDIPVNRIPGGLSGEMETAIQSRAGVASFGKLLKDLRRPAAELRRKAVLYRRVGAGQGLHGQMKRVVFSLQLGDAGLNVFGAGQQEGGIAHGMKLPRKTVGSGMEGGQTASGLIQLGRDHIPAAGRLFHFQSGFFREILLRQQIPAGCGFSGGGLRFRQGAAALPAAVTPIKLTVLN